MSSFVYQEPPWAVPPKNAWKLIEIKGGVEVASHSLTKNNKGCILLGRASDDIPLLHESCSRFHARIAFDASGTPWLRDLQSAHGTTVNRKRLPQVAIGKQESVSHKAGSRGVVLYPGDVLQFGASTRMYCLEGPPEFEPGAVKLKREMESSSQSPTQETTTDKLKQDHDGFSWGMDSDTDNGHDHGTTNDDNGKKRALPSNLDPTMIPEKHRKLFERLTAKRYKLQNVERESERIRQKGELTQGQEAQLVKNNERIAKWKEEIDELEHELHGKLYPDERKSPSRKRKVEDPVDDDEDDFDFYDRTKESEDDLFDSQEGESQESLVRKWKDLVSEWKKSDKSVKDAQQKADRLAERIQGMDPNDEDSFFLQNDLNLQRDSLQKAKEREELINHNLTETEQLLRIINTNFEFDRESGHVGEPSASGDTGDTTTIDEMDAVMMPPPAMLGSLGRPPVTLSPSATMLPPPRMPPQMEGDCMPPPVRQSSPQKRIRVMGPTMPPETGNAPILGTLSVLSAGREKKVKSPPKHKKQVGPKSSFDPKKDVWKAPEDQDGSGRTKLNEKYAGRY